MATAVYKWHTITTQVSQVTGGWKMMLWVTWPNVQKVMSSPIYSSQTAPGMTTWMTAAINQVKWEIDVAVAQAWGTPPVWWTPPAEGNPPAQWQSTTQTHTAPNGNSYTLTILPDGKVTFPSQDPNNPGQIITKNSLAEAKAYIDQMNPAQQQGQQPQGQPWQWTYPMPQIVFGTPAEVPQAGPMYQAARNDAIGQMIYNQMSWEQFASAQQAAISYYQKLMGIVNSNWGNIQIDMATGAITSNDGWNYSNTSTQVKNKVFQLFWVSSFEWLVNNNQQGNNQSDGTAQWDIKQTENKIQQNVDQMNQWLENSFNANVLQRQQVLANVPDAAPQIQERITSMNESFQTAWNMLKAAGELDAKAQAIYSNEAIANMRQQLQAKWFDASKAGPAVFFKAMKDRAGLSAEIFKLQADQQKTLADLETKRSQLVDGIKAAGIENEQWVFQQVNELNKQIESLRNNYDQARIANQSNFIMKPLLDVLSAQRQADFNNIVSKYQNQYLTANPSEKIVAAAKIYGSDWAYVASNVAMNTSGTFGEYLARCADSIRAGKLAEAEAGKPVQNVNVNTPSYA